MLSKKQGDWKWRMWTRVFSNPIASQKSGGDQHWERFLCWKSQNSSGLFKTWLPAFSGDQYWVVSFWCWKSPNKSASRLELGSFQNFLPRFSKEGRCLILSLYVVSMSGRIYITAFNWPNYLDSWNKQMQQINATIIICGAYHWLQSM